MRHVTSYRYSKPVSFGAHRMMLRPRESYDLTLVSSSLSIVPAPVSLRWIHDVFDNSLAIAIFEGVASELRFESVVTLEHRETSLPEYTLEQYAQTFPFAYAEEELPSLGLALSPQYPNEAAAAWVSKFLEPSAVVDTMGLLRSITAAIKEGFRYVRRPEKGTQSPDETLSRHQGSCRDFAVLMIEAVRCLGLAARFVSGYIFVPAALSDRVRSGGATHAWMQVYLPGAGWVDFDPTNNIVGNRNLIRVAVAWNAGQAVPLWGTFVGSADSFLGMDVTVDVTEERVAPRVG